MNVCRSTLAPLKAGHLTHTALAALADGKRFPARADFTREDVIQFRRREVDRISISGVQDKVSVILKRGKLTPVTSGGQYILKPIPAGQGLEHERDIPANEHVSMQIAAQVFGLDCGANCCIALADGELAYVTRRFDYREGRKVGQEDFCQLSNRTEETAGKNYKYDGSYEEIGLLLKKYCKIWRIEMERLFKQVVVCYLISNGDAHLKNFSLLQTEYGDYRLSPAYDLLCTGIHVPNDTVDAKFAGAVRINNQTACQFFIEILSSPNL
jgi:serine/threonine-protein kinase HipA